MTSKLDEISLAIGRLQAQIENVSVDITHIGKVSDKRHEENTSRFDKIEKTMDPLARTVAVMKPIVDSYQITRWKMAGAFAVVSMIIWAIGSLILTLAGKAITWAFSVIFR
jgi:hypothetical protein